MKQYVSTKELFIIKNLFYIQRKPRHQHLFLTNFKGKTYRIYKKHCMYHTIRLFTDKLLTNRKSIRLYNEKENLIFNETYLVEDYKLTKSCFKALMRFLKNTSLKEKETE